MVCTPEIIYSFLQFLQDPDEEIAKMEMTRKKQYENQVTHLALHHAPVISLNPNFTLRYLVIVTNVVQQIYSYHVLFSNGQGELSTLAGEECKML